MKTMFLSFLFVCTITNLRAQSGDPATIAAILRLQVQQSDRSFDGAYVLTKSSKPVYDRGFSTTTADYPLFLLGEFMTWTDALFDSKRCALVDSSAGHEYSCFIGTPVFSSDKTRCRVYMSTHYSEWGGNGCYYFYEKKRGGWKLVERSLVWIS